MSGQSGPTRDWKGESERESQENGPICPMVYLLPLYTTSFLGDEMDEWCPLNDKRSVFVDAPPRAAITVQLGVQEVKLTDNLNLTMPVLTFIAADLTQSIFLSFPLSIIPYLFLLSFSPSLSLSFFLSFFHFLSPSSLHPCFIIWDPSTASWLMAYPLAK